MSLAIIGGSGIYNIEGLSVLDSLKMETPFGEPSNEIKKLQYKKTDFYFLPRHGQNHHLLPSEINYRANIFALKKLGVTTIISISAVGSLHGEFSPEMFVLPNQFIDWTKGYRERSFFGDGLVGHVSHAYPVNKKLAKHCHSILKEMGIKSHSGGSYICIEGPGFSTRAESLFYKNMGASIIGMTNVPEVFLAKEAGIAYATLAMVTDYDCWREDHCSVEEIMKVMKVNSMSAKEFLKVAVEKFSDWEIDLPNDNEHAVVTDPKSFTDRHREILGVLLK